MVISDLDHQLMAYLCIAFLSGHAHDLHRLETFTQNTWRILWGLVSCICHHTSCLAFLPWKGFICSLQEDHQVVLKVLLWEYIQFLHPQWQLFVRHSKSLHFSHTVYLCSFWFS